MSFTGKVASWLLILQAVKCNKIDLPSKAFDGNLVNAVNEIIVKSLLQSFTTVNLVKPEKESRYVDDLMNGILTSGDENFMVRLDSIDNIQFMKSRKKKNNIILLDGIETFRQLDRIIDPNVFYFQGSFLLVLINGKLDEIEEIFSTFWKKNIFNVNVIFQTADSIHVMTFLPFDGSRCGSTTPKTINVYQNGSFRHGVDSIYPDKFVNLRGCPLKVSTFEDIMSVTSKQTADGSFEITGFDIDLLSELSKILNFKTTIKLVDDPQPAWAVKNIRLEVVLRDAANGNSDVAIGALHWQYQRLQIADSSIAYLSFPAVFVISPGRQLSNFEKLLRPFDSVIWILLSIMLLIALLVVFILNFKLKKLRLIIFGSGTQHPVTNILIGFCGGTQPNLPKQSFPRFLLMMLLIFFLVIRNSYQGSLYKFLQSDSHQRDVQTIDEMIEQEFDLYIYNSQLVMFENLPKAKYGVGSLLSLITFTSF